MCLHLVFRGIFLFVKGGETVGLKAQTLIFSRSYLPCQVLGFSFSDPWGLGFERPSLTTTPSTPRRTAHRWWGQLSLGAPARFRTSQGPLPARACPAAGSGGSARADTINKVGRPRPRRSAGFSPAKEGRITRETLTAVSEKPKEEGRKKAFFQTWTPQ